MPGRSRQHNNLPPRTHSHLAVGVPTIEVATAVNEVLIYDWWIDEFGYRDFWSGLTGAVATPPPANQGLVSVDADAGFVTFTPAFGFAGRASFTLQLKDTIGTDTFPPYPMEVTVGARRVVQALRCAVYGRAIYAPHKPLALGRAASHVHPTLPQHRAAA